MINLCKVLIISCLYVSLCGCKSQSKIIKKERTERTDTTDDIIEEQMLDYRQELQEEFQEID